MDNRIKVLHVVHWPMSGIVSLLKNIISAMPAGEIESHIIFFYHNPATINDFSKICASVHCLNLSQSYIRGIIEYRSILKRISPHVLHTHSFQPAIWGGVFNYGKTNHISTIHNDYPYFKEKNLKAFIKREVQKWLFNISGISAVAVSRKVYSTIAELRLSLGNLYLIENGFPIAEQMDNIVRLESLREETRTTADDLVLVTVGRLDIGQKGYDVLLRAFQDVSQQINNVILMFIGDGPDMERLREMADDLGISEKIRFLGFKKNPEYYLSMAKIYVSSSIFEGFPLAVGEAMLCSLPVIATQVGGIPDMIEHNVSGVLVEPGNSKAIASAIKELISRRTDLKIMGIKGREAIIKRFDINRTSALYLDLYKNVVKQSKNI